MSFYISGNINNYSRFVVDFQHLSRILVFYLKIINTIEIIELIWYTSSD